MARLFSKDFSPNSFSKLCISLFLWNEKMGTGSLKVSTLLIKVCILEAGVKKGTRKLFLRKINK